MAKSVALVPETHNDRPLNIRLLAFEGTASKAFNGRRVLQRTDPQTQSSPRTTGISYTSKAS